MTVTCDVTIHHLLLTADAMVNYDPNTKVWPPLRHESDRQALLSGVKDGTVDAIVSDGDVRTLRGREPTRREPRRGTAAWRRDGGGLTHRCCTHGIFSSRARSPLKCRINVVEKEAHNARLRTYGVGHAPPALGGAAAASDTLQRESVTSAAVRYAPRVNAQRQRLCGVCSRVACVPHSSL